MSVFGPLDGPEQLQKVKERRKDRRIKEYKEKHVWKI